MTEADRRLIEDVYVAQVLVLSKQIVAEEKGYNSKSPIARAMDLISKERSRILAGNP